jgi:hypothetical protein
LEFFEGKRLIEIGKYHFWMEDEPLKKFMEDKKIMIMYTEDSREVISISERYLNEFKAYHKNLTKNS